MGLQIEDILNKIASTPIPKVKKCAIAYSGGLDSTLGIELLRRVYKAKRLSPSTSMWSRATKGYKSESTGRRNLRSTRF